MGLVNFVFSTVGKCIDVVSFLLDLNFVIVHSLIRSVLAVITFVNNLPMLTVNSVVEFGDFTLFCLISIAEATSVMAHGMLGSCVMALGGVIESLKMVGYLSMHVVLRGKEQLYRGLLWLLECCSISLSLVLYFTNTVVNFALIATQNLYSALVSVWQAVSSPLQKVLELTLTLFTFLYSSLVGTSSFIWTPCKLALDFLFSAYSMFIGIFILNIYGLLLTVTIVVATTHYLHPELTHQGTRWVVDYVSAVPALHRLAVIPHRLTSGLQRALYGVPGVVRRLQRILHRLLLLERRLWQRLSQQGSRLGQALRTRVHRNDNNNRVGGDGDPGEERRDPPDGRAGDGAHQELMHVVLPSSSTDRPLKKLSSLDKDSKVPPADSLLSLLKEQEERKKCVICQDCTKTVVLLPCRHLCLCRHCTNILLRQPIYQQNCPLCRHMIINTMDVYL